MIEYKLDMDGNLVKTMDNIFTDENVNIINENIDIVKEENILENITEEKEILFKEEDFIGTEFKISDTYETSLANVSMWDKFRNIFRLSSYEREVFKQVKDFLFQDITQGFKFFK